jgi:CDGSH-type Zn-finger protein
MPNVGTTAPKQKIEVEFDGPYRVEGNIPLVRKTQVVSEFGEPLTWQKEQTIETSGSYNLCRCGQSHDKPFCDCTHLEIGFDGTEAADTGKTAERQVTFEGGAGITVKRDYSLCMESGFCGNRRTNIEKMIAQTTDPQVRAQIMAMIERCPSGSYVYSVQEGGPEIEPDLPIQIAVTTEITDEGAIEGPLWVTGNVPIVRSDSQPFETRNRVTLCSCGLSKTKPLCDGTHREHPVYRK